MTNTSLSRSQVTSRTRFLDTGWIHVLEHKGFQTLKVLVEKWTSTNRWRTWADMMSTADASEGCRAGERLHRVLRRRSSWEGAERDARTPELAVNLWAKSQPLRAKDSSLNWKAWFLPLGDWHEERLWGPPWWSRGQDKCFQWKGHRFNPWLGN